MLSCSCDFDGAEWYYTPSSDFTPFKSTRRKRCCSCNDLINQKDPCIELYRFKWDDSGDEIGLASWFLCEWCGEMFLNLDHLGYCYWAGDNLRECMEEYHELTGFKKGQ